MIELKIGDSYDMASRNYRECLVVKWDGGSNLRVKPWISEQ